MKHTILTIAAIAILPVLIPTNAEAGPRCKTYTKTIKIDGKREIGYGKACRVRGDVWEIVKLSASHKAKKRLRAHIVDDLYDRGFYIAGYHHPHRHYAAYDYGRYDYPYYGAKHKARKYYRRCD